MDYYQLWVQSVTIKHFLAHYSPLPCYELACPVFSGYQTVSTQDKQLGSQLWALPLISQHSILFYSTQWTFMANSVPDQIKQYRI